MSASAATTLRSTRIGGSVTARQRASTSVKSGNLFISDIQMPSGAISPGGTALIEVTVSNGAVAIFDADQCFVGDKVGYDTELTVDPDWTGRDIEQFCITTASIGTRDLTFEFDFRVPETPGVYDVEFWLFLPGSSTESGHVTRSIEVDEEGDVSPPPDDTENGGAGDGGDGGGSSPEDIIRGASIFLGLTILLLVLGNVLD